MSLNLSVCTPPYRKIPGVCSTAGVTLADRSKPLSTIDRTPLFAIRRSKSTWPEVKTRGEAITVPVTYVDWRLELMIWIVAISSSRAPSLGVVSVTMTWPGP
ncbi:MAG: hypothetical protein ACXWNX_15185 [Isosphaeraceae bacterium]